MSIQATADPACNGCESTPDIATLIDGKPRDIGGFGVRRLLPSAARRRMPFVPPSAPSLACGTVPPQRAHHCPSVHEPRATSSQAPNKLTGYWLQR